HNNGLDYNLKIKLLLINEKLIGMDILCKITLRNSNIHEYSLIYPFNGRILSFYERIWGFNERISGSNERISDSNERIPDSNERIPYFYERI
ncbi:hypothetical protein, partial [Neobacillus drentensis]|uniref:hypothetical protein n=1 Tax=Neobacillus drentensis TaxID=220684 RepID=UPI002FFDF451